MFPPGVPDDESGKKNGGSSEGGLALMLDVSMLKPTYGQSELSCKGQDGCCCHQSMLENCWC